MTNFRQKFLGTLALVFTMSFNGFAQCSCTDLDNCFSQVNSYVAQLSTANTQTLIAEYDAANYENLYNQASELINSLQGQLDNTAAERDSLNSLLTEIRSERDAIISEVNSSSSDGYFNLTSGWSLFGYTCLESLNVVDAFYEISTSIVIVKDELGLAYLPEFGFSALGSLEFGEGYQIKMVEEVNDFQFCKKIAPVDIGCPDPNAFNYSPDASIGINSICVEKVFGCLDEDYLEFDSSANTNDESQCLTLKVYGCVNLLALNHSAEANVDDDSCVLPIYGCMDEAASNFNSNAILDAMVESITYFDDENWQQDSNGDIIYFTDTFNDEDLNAVVNSGGYRLWGTGFEIQENSSVTISFIGDLPFNIESFGSTQIESMNYDGYQYQDCMMFGVDQYNEYYGEYEGAVSSCDDLFEFTPFATISGSNGYSFQISNENYGGSEEFWGNLTQNLIGCVYINIETEDGVKFKLTNVSIQSVDQSSSSCIPVLLGCIQEDQCNYNPLATDDDGSCYNNDVGCGCDVPLPEEGYNCLGNLMVGEVGDTINGGILFYIDETGQHGLIADFEDLGFLPWQDGVDACSSSTNGGFDDWYLPSIDELGLLINTLALNNNNIMNLDFNHEWAGYYWSSTLSGNRVYRSRIYGATSEAPSLSLIGTSYPEDPYFVRAIRAF